jgi:TolA-binding protein
MCAMGFLSSLFKKSRPELPLNAKVTREEGPGPQPTSLNAHLNDPKDFAAAKAMREAFFSVAGKQGDETAEVNAACALMLDQKFDEVKPAWDAIAAKYPHRRGEADSQIGAAEFFKGDFHKAIEFYASARSHGEDASMMDDNIWEACEALVKKGDKAAAQRYLELCPEGSYVKQARKALS